MTKQSDDTFQPILPRLKKDHRVANLNVKGQWKERRQEELENVSLSLDVTPVEMEINSIPDMWARPLLFEMALFDEDHVLHERVLGEWRGLLAMLGLREKRNISGLTVEAVQIPKLDRNSGQLQQPDFLVALSRLIPESTLAQDTSWHELYIFLFDQEPVGITSPTTLVCTATSCFDRIHGLPENWFDGRYLKDPTNHLALTDREALASWLSHLNEKLTGHAETDQVRLNRLTGLLKRFIIDVGGEPKPRLDLSDRKLQITRGIFVHLRHPIRYQQTESDVYLVASREPAPAKKILVVEHEIADQWDMQSQDIHVYDGVQLDSAIPFGGFAGKENQVGDNLVQGVRVWQTENFFCEKLFVISQSDDSGDNRNAFPGTLTEEIRGTSFLRDKIGHSLTPLLPINKDILDYLTIEDLSERIEFEQTNEGGIRVTLTLMLSGSGGKPGDYEISREFSMNQIVPLEAVPVLEVWPNFRFEHRSGSSQATATEDEQEQRRVDWQAYYTYFSLAGVEANATFYADPYIPGIAPDAVQEIKNQRGEVERRITQTKVFPEAMICHAQIPGARKMETVYAGVLLLKSPGIVEPGYGTIKIGIDFGASGTHIYYSLDDRAPEPVVFNNRSLKVTAYSNRKISELYMGFVPNEMIAAPFLSIYHDFQQNVARMRSLIDGHIFFLHDPSAHFTENTSVKTDLKWSREANNNVRVKAFWEQLCLQCAAEAVNLKATKVKWAYSLPTAFSSTQREIFKLNWQQVVNACINQTGLALTEDGLPECKTESEASALFFKEKVNANVATGAVCIDIGSSTSDIAVWQNEKAKWQTSIRFAGRDIFLNPLRAQMDVLTNLFGINVDSLEKARSHPPSFYAQADALLKQYGEDFLNLLRTRGDVIKPLTQLITIGLSGMLFYSGILLRYLIEIGKYDSNVPNVYIGGNGSRLFHWVANGAYNRDSAINQLFSKMLLYAAKLDENRNLSVILSPTPKAEAAYGLVVVKAQVRYEGGGEEGVLSGEAFSEHGNEKGWNTLLTSEALKNGLKPPTRLDNLVAFLQCFNDYATSTRRELVEPISVDIDEVRDALAASLSNFTFQNEAEIGVEPVFILALKCLLEIKIRDLAPHLAAGE